MPAFSHLPGTISPENVDGRAEWVPSGEGVLHSLEVRLGSETDASKLLLAALPPLRASLTPDSWEALLEELPFGPRAMLRDAVSHPGAVPRLEDREAYLAFVSRHAQHPPEQTAIYVAAVFDTLRSRLPPALADAVAGELPETLRPLWNQGVEASR